MHKILIIAAVVGIVGAVLASVVVVGRTILSSAATPPTTDQQPTKLPPPAAPKKVATPAATPLTQRPATPAASPAAPATPPTTTTTSTGWAVTGLTNVTITPSLSTDEKNLSVSFGGTGLSSVSGMDYYLTYIADPNTSRLVKGSFTSPYTQKTIALGTCSGTTCVYDTNPHTFTLKVVVKSNNGLSANLVTLTLPGNLLED